MEEASLGFEMRGIRNTLNNYNERLSALEFKIEILQMQKAELEEQIKHNNGGRRRW